MVERQRLRVMTNGFEVARELAQNTTNSVILIGGIVNNESSSVTGLLSEHIIEELQAVKRDLPFVESIFLFDATLLVRTNEEIQEFASGKDEAFQPKKVHHRIRDTPAIHAARRLRLEIGDLPEFRAPRKGQLPRYGVPGNDVLAPQRHPSAAGNRGPSRIGLSACTKNSGRIPAKNVAQSSGGLINCPICFANEGKAQKTVNHALIT